MGYASDMDRDEVVRVLRAFESVKLEYVLIGAGAMGFHGIARATFETIDAEVKEVEGTKVRVATQEALYRLKKGTVRPQDQADAAALRERFGLKEDG